MPTELDEQYTLMALATLIAFVMIAWDMMVSRQAALTPATAPADSPPAIAAETSAAVVTDQRADEIPAPANGGEPVWRERLGRRVSGGKRRKRR
jgi:hypothetical protein